MGSRVSDDVPNQLNQLTLIPRPSSTPWDPLNWSWSRKCLIVATLALASFASDGASAANFLALDRQAFSFHKTPLEVSYGISAAFAGYWIGPWTYPLLFRHFGKCAVVFWGVTLQLLIQVWSACMTGPDDYAGYIASRFCSGLVASIPFAAGCAAIMDMFFLHQRGRMFALLELAYVFGVFAVPTIGGFIIQAEAVEWSWCFWWVVILISFVELSIFIFMEETEFDRDMNQHGNLGQGRSFLQKRMDCFVLTSARRKVSSRESLLGTLFSPLIIMLAPNVIVVGIFNMVCFGFAAGVSITANIFLQSPSSQGGYGFSPGQNALFSFAAWAAIIFGFLFGYATGDRVPLTVCRRRNGVWCPEYRLLNLVLPGILLPIGLGIFGASLKYHLHYLVLALAVFLTQFSAQIGIPFCVNYVAENFVNYPTAVVVAMNGLRLPLATAIPFAVQPWLNAIGPGWVFGSAAFIALFVFVATMTIMMCCGRTMRRFRCFKNLGLDEDGAVIFRSPRSDHSRNAA